MSLELAAHEMARYYNTVWYVACTPTFGLYHLFLEVLGDSKIAANHERQLSSDSLLLRCPTKCFDEINISRY